MPATSAGVVNTSRVADTEATTAGLVRPMRTWAFDGMAVPVTVTRVPPSTPTRVGLIEVSPNGPLGG